MDEQPLTPKTSASQLAPHNYKKRARVALRGMPTRPFSICVFARAARGGNYAASYFDALDE